MYCKIPCVKIMNQVMMNIMYSLVEAKMRSKILWVTFINIGLINKLYIYESQQEDILNYRA